MADTAATVLAWLRHDVPDPPPLCLVCSLGCAGISLMLCTSRSGLVSVIDTESVRPPAAVDRRLAHPGARRPGVLRQAMSNARFRDAIVFEDAAGPARAGGLIDAFTPYGAFLASAVTQLLARNPKPAVSELGYVPVGELAAFPLAADVLAAALPGSRLLATDGVDAIQRGGELLGSEAVRFPDSYPYAVALRTREIRGGRLINSRVIVAPAHTLGAVGKTVFGEPHGRPVTVEPSDDGAVELDVLIGVDDARPLTSRRIERPEPGCYAVGMRLVHGVAELWFVPDGAGTPATRTIGSLPAGRS